MQYYNKLGQAYLMRKSAGIGDAIDQLKHKVSGHFNEDPMYRVPAMTDAIKLYADARDAAGVQRGATRYGLAGAGAGLGAGLGGVGGGFAGSALGGLIADKTGDDIVDPEAREKRKKRYKILAGILGSGAGAALGGVGGLKGADAVYARTFGPENAVADGKLKDLWDNKLKPLVERAKY